ncbi:MAG: tRNA lysidine(34) synthetase TilS [Candidatus Delongbacteria bacterium]|nr:tRNA lysidine(34) synthetase TilS [Candidatus Delongbacteria bacterium]
MRDNDLKKIVERTLRNVLDFNTDLKLAVSYSGGIDSAVLLDIILQLHRSGEISTPKVIYFNHNLRGEESNNEKQFIENKFRDTDIDIRIIDLDVNKLSKEKNISTESAARELRYLHLEAIAKDVDHILLGHHRDDNIETVFFNFLRGSGLNGLEGIKKFRGKYLRPMLDSSKEEIIQYAEKNNIEYVTDSSNFKDEFSRNKIRNNIIPFIEKELNRNIKNSIQNLSQNVTEVNEYLNTVVSQFLDNNINARNLNKSLWILNREMFDKENVVIQKLIINQCLKTMKMDYNLDSKSIRSIVEHIALKNNNILEFYSHEIEVYGNNILILGPNFTKDNISSISISGDGESEYYFDASKVNKKLKYSIVDLENDFKPFGKINPEKVRKVLSDKKIPKIFREHLKIISQNCKIIFIQGVGISNDIKTDKATSEKKFISIENNYLENLF